ncbi:extracellular catalytic domain type 2 short-chain-length polyhydroxyalkanoate depolymerase [Novosphingobium sp. KACC 22771]|uniref:extracellular catalytic domain type 2 short-chain-length polyhydroxyalkanoate depolymerase n=1 Tax=Novosphingobium sp. KACC 22771 TaxID=3025670 RepID=UPI0023652EBD|nr:PHB depolymerase family esterase [Novosphingobium sp. KACC 22771]WDF73909.1 PHB depolymerase family esterase [Novosphingobium sp. KACC 22771]
MRMGRTAFFIMLPFASMAAAADKLPAYHADAARVSVSGLSSGAFMAVQYDVAFSGSVIGVGVVAGGPYNCAWVNFGGIATCMQGAPIGAASYGAASSFAALGSIDPVTNLAKHKVYLFSGTKDIVVKQSAMNATRDFYVAARVPAANLRYVSKTPAGHAFLSGNFGSICGANAAPYVNECKVGAQFYDQPGAILSHIYGPLRPKPATLSAQPIAFDQSEFAGAIGSGMASTGYVYVPAACRDGGAPCAVHVVFHGCLQSADLVGDAVYGRLGYNAWADANRIIALYPQVNKSTIPANPQGCWDWWGYSGLNFQTQSGAQLSAIRAMVRRLTS